MLEVHAILHRQRCYENMTEKTGTLSDAYKEKALPRYVQGYINGSFLAALAHIRKLP